MPTKKDDFTVCYAYLANVASVLDVSLPGWWLVKGPADFTLRLDGLFPDLTLALFEAFAEGFGVDPDELSSNLKKYKWYPLNRIQTYKQWTC